MKKIMQSIFSRVVITGLLIVIQFIWLVFAFLHVVESSVWINVFMTILSVGMALYIINKDENPAYKLGWILIIGLVPLLGGAFYLIFGNKRPSKRMRDKLAKQEELFKDQLMQDNKVLEELEPRIRSTAKYISDYGPYPIHKNTTSEYYRIGEDMYKSMKVDLENAKHFIFLEYFILAESNMWNEMLDILINKSNEGLDVRLMYDDVGSISVVPKDLLLTCKNNNIKCIPFNPMIPLVSVVMNNRDHRKILVIDGYIGYTGGINIADEYINLYEKYGHWKDTGIRLLGEAVWNLTIMFLNMWNGLRKTDTDYDNFRPHKYHHEAFNSDGYIQPYSDTPLDDETIGENVYIDIVSQAEKYVYIFTPYLIIDNEMQTSLTLAAKRGVDVRIVTPGIPDKKIVFRLTRSYYPSLIAAGVKIYEYSPGFIHAKSYVCDDKIAVVGTINMDYRSLYLHFECGALIIKSSIINQIKEDCISVFNVSKLITSKQMNRNIFSGFINAILRVLSPLL